MTPSSPTPKLPQWIFFVTDAVLLLTAWYIASRGNGPLSAAAIYSVVACVIVGAIIGTIPLILRYERDKNEALDDRQRALEALASTLTASAEQISIAAQGLHAIAELSQQNLRMAEQLPTRLQEKIAEFESQLANAQSDERDEMKKELSLLRASESDRLEAIAAKVDHAAGEMTKLEAATQKHLAAAQTALAKAPEALAAATTAALAQIESKLSAHVEAATASPAAAPQDEPRRNARVGSSDGASSARRGEGAPAKSAGKATDEGTHIVPIVPPTMAPFAGDIVSIAPEVTVPPFAGNLISSTPPVAVPETPVAASPATDAPVAAASEEVKEPPKKRAPRKPKPTETTEPAPALVLESDSPTPATPSPDEPRRNHSRDGGGRDEFNQTVPDVASKPAAEIGETVISSDGATRLLVTAYIGIGNRLFIRGDGPGLSWDKGVPLQFVSIGKWRWETTDAAAPVKFKLYKNDEIECTALGRQTIKPDHQQEITAAF